MPLLTNLGNRIVGYSFVVGLGLLNVTLLEVGPVNIQTEYLAYAVCDVYQQTPYTGWSKKVTPRLRKGCHFLWTTRYINIHFYTTP